MAQMKTVIAIPKWIRPRDREILGDAVIEFIRSRSLDGLDKNNKKFAKYSKEYAIKKGVSRDSVDLILSGEMLEGIRLLSHGSGKITIGFDADDPLNGRAEGNIKGTYGQSEQVTKPRDFLGITKKDLNGIIDAADSEEITLDNGSIDAIARRAAREVLGDIDFET